MKIYLISFIISFFMMAISGVVIFNILQCIDPPVTEEGHVYMPTENLVKSFFSSLAVAAVVFISAVKIQRHQQKKKH
ncbi:hypothetical protein [Chryseobacterium sp. JK1]|uniref:hypothetical protein n=1 Tax=Chryseobacterium sp. JK1 TaxID=874294 RepID=UPI003D68AB9D